VESSEIRVLIVDDHAVVRKGLAMVLDLEQDITIVGEAENGEQATRMAGTLQPDVVLLDRVMPGKAVSKQSRKSSGSHLKPGF